MQYIHNEGALKPKILARWIEHWSTMDTQWLH